MAASDQTGPPAMGEHEAARGGLTIAG